MAAFRALACGGPTSQTPSLAARPAAPIAATRPASTWSSTVAGSCLPSCVTDAETRAEDEPALALEAVLICLRCPEVTPTAYLLAADLYGDLDDLTAARRLLNEGKERFAGHAALWESASRYAQAVGDVEAALDDLAVAVQLQPTDARLASAYRLLVKRFGSPQAQAKTEVDALLAEADDRYAVGDIDGAKATIDDALATGQRFSSLQAKVRLRRALISIRQNRFDDARSDLDAALVEASADNALAADIQLARAELGLTIEDYGLARTAAEAAIAGRPEDPLAYVNLSLAYVHLGERKPAFQALSTAIDKGLAAHLTRAQMQALVVSAPWAERQPAVDALVYRAWPPPPAVEY